MSPWWKRGKSGCWVRVKHPLLRLFPFSIVRCVENFVNTGDTAERPPELTCGLLNVWMHWHVRVTTTTIDSPVILETIRTLWLNCVCHNCLNRQMFICQLVIVKKWQQDSSNYLMITKECIRDGICFELLRDGAILDREEWNR